MGEERRGLLVEQGDVLHFLPAGIEGVQVLDFQFPGTADLQVFLLLVYAQKATPEEIGSDARCAASGEGVENPCTRLSGCQDDAREYRRDRRFSAIRGRTAPKGKEKNEKSREKIIHLLSEDGKLSAASLAEKWGISAKAVEKHLARLKADGIIERIGLPRVVIGR